MKVETSSERKVCVRRRRLNRWRLASGLLGRGGRIVATPLIRWHTLAGRHEMSSQQIAATRGALSILAFACVIAIGNSPASATRLDSGTAPPSTAAAAGSALADTERRVRNDYASLPVAFVENVGQADASVRYYAQGSRFGFYLTQKEVLLALTKENVDSGVALALRFIGGNPHARIEGVDRAPGEVSYLRGTDPAAWHTRVARYGQVAYRDLWPGIDLYLREQTGVLKYQFHVRPGARPSDIRLAYAGAAGPFAR